jgi:hypothetical protein
VVVAQIQRLAMGEAAAVVVLLVLLELLHQESLEEQVTLQQPALLVVAVACPQRLPQVRHLLLARLVAVAVVGLPVVATLAAKDQVAVYLVLLAEVLVEASTMLTLEQLVVTVEKESVVQLLLLEAPLERPAILEGLQQQPLIT